MSTPSYTLSSQTSPPHNVPCPWSPSSFLNECGVPSSSRLGLENEPDGHRHLLLTTRKPGLYYHYYHPMRLMSLMCSVWEDRSLQLKVHTMDPNRVDTEILSFTTSMMSETMAIFKFFCFEFIFEFIYFQMWSLRNILSINMAEYKTLWNSATKQPILFL